MLGQKQLEGSDCKFMYIWSTAPSQFFSPGVFIKWLHLAHSEMLCVWQGQMRFAAPSLLPTVSYLFCPCTFLWVLFLSHLVFISAVTALPQPPARPEGCETRTPSESCLQEPNMWEENSSPCFCFQCVSCISLPALCKPRLCPMLLFTKGFITHRHLSASAYKACCVAAFLAICMSPFSGTEPQAISVSYGRAGRKLRVPADNAGLFRLTLKAERRCSLPQKHILGRATDSKETHYTPSAVAVLATTGE